MEIGRTMIEAYNAIGYAAFNVSVKDFAAGLDYLKELEENASFPFLSANILDSTTHQLIFKPYIIKKLGGKKFGIIGVSAPIREPVSGIEVADIAESLEEILPVVRSEVDYIILLAYLGRVAESEFFKQSFDVDFILESGTYRYSRSLDVKDNTLIARPGNIGKYVGIVRFDLQKPDVAMTDISTKTVQLIYAERRLSILKNSAGDQSIEKFYENKPDVLRTIRSLEAQMVILTDEVSNVTNPVDFELVDLDETIPDDSGIRAMLNKLEQKVGPLQSD
jgi:2',3'-cyclic-nucleotide 2'-phosphodiesterase (5'-nucleotidase family)